MARIVGVQLPDNKRLEIALTYIYGIGLQTSRDILKKTKIDPNIRIKDLDDKQVQTLQKAVEAYPNEGILRKILSENIQRLKQINTYRGKRHSAGLPARGQRTRHNARTKRGKRQTVGAMKKELQQKMEKSAKEKQK